MILYNYRKEIHQERKVKDMRKTTLAIYRWDDNKAWVYVGCTPISEQAENIINNYKKQGIESKTILRYL